MDERGNLLHTDTDDDDCGLCSKIEAVRENCRYAGVASEECQTTLQEMREEPEEEEYDEEEIGKQEKFAEYLEKILDHQERALDLFDKVANHCESMVYYAQMKNGNHHNYGSLVKNGSDVKKQEPASLDMGLINAEVSESYEGMCKEEAALRDLMAKDGKMEGEEEGGDQVDEE